jgi:hypothetical protein
MAEEPIMEVERFLDDGKVKVWPNKHYDKDLVIGYLGAKFEENRTYSEQEVNEILKFWHTFNDWPLLRRELVDRGLLTRDTNGHAYKITPEIINFSKPSEFLSKVLTYLPVAGIVLDVGAGNGRNIKLLEDSGWRVMAVESDTIACSRLRRIYDDQEVEILGDDIRKIFPDMTFDLIYFGMVLHFFSEEEVEVVLKRSQEHTSIGGLNGIVMFTDSNPKSRRPYLLPKGKLAKLYSEWDILEDYEAFSNWYYMAKERAYRRSHNAYFIARKRGEPR